MNSEPCESWRCMACHRLLELIEYEQMRAVLSLIWLILIKQHINSSNDQRGVKGVIMTKSSLDAGPLLYPGRLHNAAESAETLTLVTISENQINHIFNHQGNEHDTEIKPFHSSKEIN